MAFHYMVLRINTSSVSRKCIQLTVTSLLLKLSFDYELEAKSKLEF